MGDCTDRYAFTAFGELLEHTGEDPNAYLFAGEMLDPNSGFYYNRARWMDPGVGRFASADIWPGSPWEPASLHKYSYASDRPTDLTDPLGLFSLGEMALVMLVVGLVWAAAQGIRAGLAGKTRGEIAKAEAVAFLQGAGVAAAVYAVIWGGFVLWIGAVTGGVTFSPQIYNAYQRGHAYYVTLDRTTTVYRYTGYPGGTSGQWWSTTHYSTAAQAVQELALPAQNTAQYVYTGVLPAGTPVLIGRAAPLFGNPGGGVQLYVSDPVLMNFLGTLP